MISPVPNPTESPEAFSIRAHRALSRYVADPMERNRIIRQQWAKHRGQTEEEQIAARAFDPERYAKEEDVCVFAEHEATDSQGQARKYDLAELARITRSLNRRIVDHDGFAPISDGHTVDDPEPGQEPDVLGYSGPFRLGMIGRKDPRWAIFEDEWHIRGEPAKRLSGKRGRSVELWTYANQPNKSHFYPVAAIGAEAPRLPLPQKFRRATRDGVAVERYTFSMPASPGAGSTFLKRFGPEGSMLTNEDVSQIMQALSETPQFKWIESQMPSSEPAAAPEPEPDNYMSDHYQDDEDEEMPAPEAPMPEDDAAADDPIADLNELIADAGEEDEEEEPIPMMRKRHSRRAADKPTQDGSLAVRYQRLQNAHNKLVQQQGRMANQLMALHKDRADAERTATLMEVERKYPNFIDLDEELGRVLYSRGADVSAPQFDAHVATLTRYAQRAEQQMVTSGADLPMGSVDRGPRNDAENDRYQAALANEAVKIHTAAVNAGRESDYDSCIEEAKRKLQKAG